MNSENDESMTQSQTESVGEEEGLEEPEESKGKVKKVRPSVLSYFKSKGFIVNSITLVSILVIMYLAVFVRSSTLVSPTVLDYDPWFWYRRAEMILNNNMRIPKWDELSHHPPGRPVEIFQGWSYMIIIFYKILNPLMGMTLTDVSKWSTLIVAAATVVPAYLLGKLLSNKIGGVATALFGILSTALIGVSMAGYCDTDMPVVFFSFLVVYSVLLALTKKFGLKTLPYYIFAIVTNVAFVFTWGYGWIIMLFFTGFIPAIFIFRAIEQIVHKRSLKIDMPELKKEFSIVKSLLIIIIPTNIIGYLLGYPSIIPFLPMFEILAMGLLFAGGKLLLVNISVAELQTLNIFTKSGFEAIVARVGLGPVLFTLTLPLLAFYKIYRREKVEAVEIFLYIWAFVTFFLITLGVRFSLLFSTATAVAGSYAIGNIPKYIKNRFFKATFYGFTFLILLIFVSTAISAGFQGAGMMISNNWYDMLDWLKENAHPKSLIVTWWDPGHIIAGYTGLPVHADGAHCGALECIPYNHDDRIQDMGRIFAISDENESLSILKKYRQLKPEQCAEVRQAYGSKVPDEVCDEIPEMFVIASNDLIGKYYWMSYFGTGTGRNYFQMQMTGYDPNQGVIEYNDGQLRLVFDNGQWIPVLNFPQQGVRNVPIRNIVYFENGQERRLNFTDMPNTIDGMVWVDPSYTAAMFMDASIRDSVFTRMFFFNGVGLQNFELVYQNPEIRVFKVIF